MASSRTPARGSPRFRRSLVYVVSAACAGGVALGLLMLWPEAPVEAAPRPNQGAVSLPEPRSSASELQRSQSARWLLSNGPDAGAPGGAGSLRRPGLFDEVRLSPASDRLLHEATETALVSCMRERGFQYVANPWMTEAEQADAGGMVERRPGDLENARAHGYGLSEAVEARERPPPDANREYVEHLSADAQRAWREALEGPPIEPTGPPGGADVGTVSVPGGPMVQWNRGSCLARAQRGVYGDDVRHTELTMMLDVLREEVDERARADPAYGAGVERWRACMSSRGFPYSEPEAAVDALVRETQRGQITGEQLRRREIDVASADADCFREVNLKSSFDEAHARAEAAVERESRGVLESMIALQTGALERAGGSAPR